MRRPTPSQVALGVIMAGFAAASAFHLADIVRYGWLPYRFAPLHLNAFWTSLTVFDPLVIAALGTGRRRVGLVLAAAIMVADIAANSYALYALGEAAFAVPLQLQTAFAGFVAGATGFLWPPTKKPGALG